MQSTFAIAASFVAFVKSTEPISAPQGGGVSSQSSSYIWAPFSISSRYMPVLMSCVPSIMRRGDSHTYFIWELGNPFETSWF